MTARRLFPSVGFGLRSPTPGRAGIRSAAGPRRRGRRDPGSISMIRALASSLRVTQSRAAAGDLPCATWRAISRSTRSLVTGQVPGRIEQGPDRGPGLLVEQQVIALGDHQRDRARDLDGVLDRAVEIAAEQRRADTGSVPSRSRARSATYPAASKVGGAPLRSRRPNRTSSPFGRWKPSIGTSTAWGRAPRRCAANDDLPAPGGPAMPRIRRGGGGGGGGADRPRARTGAMDAQSPTSSSPARRTRSASGGSAMVSGSVGGGMG